MKLLVAAIFTTLACLASPALAKKLPASAYGAMPKVSDVAISPNGEYVASLGADDEGQSFAAIYELAGGKLKTVVTAPKGLKTRSVSWGDNRYALVTFSQFEERGLGMGDEYRYKFENFRVSTVDAETGKVRIVGDENVDRSVGFAINRVFAAPEGDPGYGRAQQYDVTTGPSLKLWLMRVNLATGKLDGIENVSTRGGGAYILGPDGNAAARLLFLKDDTVTRWRLERRSGNDWTMVKSDEAYLATGFLGLLPGGDRIAFFSDAEDESKEALFSISLANGEIRKEYEDAQYDVGYALSDPWTYGVVGVRVTRDYPENVFFDPQLKAIQEKASAKFPDTYALVESWDRQRKKAIVYAETLLDPGAYYILDVEKDTWSRFAPAYPKIVGAEAMGQKFAIRYKARDGASVPAYVTAPAGDPPKNRPLIVLPHGGPRARDDMRFDFIAAFLASRGYVVLQPNFRGSSGYGVDWRAAGYGQWGRRMQDDVNDGVAALAKAGMIDPKRVCVAGASYGGYVALAAATLTPDDYRCAISLGGVSNLLDIRDVWSRKAGKEAEKRGAKTDTIADLALGTEGLRAVSPLHNADKIKIPVLLMHGVDDTVVPIDHSEAMYRKLGSERARLVKLRGDDHWLSTNETRIQVLEEMERFLAEHLPAN